MLAVRRRLLAASLTGALALTGAGLVLPSATAPAQAATCSESHQAKVLRASAKATITVELRTYGRLVPVASLAVETATQKSTDVLADPASTQQQKDIAAADLTSATEVDRIVATALEDAKAAKADLPTCGLSAMRKLNARAVRIARTMAIDSAVSARTQYRVHLRADGQTRDSFLHGDADQYAHWSKVVESDQALLDSLHDLIAQLR